jgi:hypothetical protein
VDGDVEMADAEGGDEENGKKRKVVQVFPFASAVTQYDILCILENGSEILW